jgi:hypothetical protein
MLDNKYRREHVLPLYRSEANRTIEGLKFYLETLESFIETEREREISNLQKKVEHLSEDDQGEFWAWRYPIHWDDIFATHLRKKAPRKEAN